MKQKLSPLQGAPISGAGKVKVGMTVPHQGKFWQVKQWLGEGRWRLVYRRSKSKFSSIILAATEIIQAIQTAAQKAIARIGKRRQRNSTFRAISSPNRPVRPAHQPAVIKSGIFTAMPA